MPPQSRGEGARLGSHSLSTPNLRSLAALQTSSLGASPDHDRAEEPHTVAVERFPYFGDGTFDTEQHGSSKDHMSQLSNSQSISRPFSLSSDSNSSNISDDDSNEGNERPELSTTKIFPASIRATLDDTSAQSDFSSLAQSVKSLSSVAPPGPIPGAFPKVPHINTRPATGHRTQSLYEPDIAARNQYSSFLARPQKHQVRLGPIPAAFAPPFYNRPPTPLPPSPSLTSLLRPSLNAWPSSSRPSTPLIRSPTESSDNESETGGYSGLRTTTNNRNATTADSDDSRSTRSILQKSALGPNIPSKRSSASGPPSTDLEPTSSPTTTAAAAAPTAIPHIPTNEYYGFVLHVTSSVAFFMYLVWAVLPKPILHQLGLYYYPNRWWALAVPAWLVVALVWLYVALAAWNTEYLTLKVGRLGCIVDTKGVVAVVDSKGKIIRQDRLRPLATPPESRPESRSRSGLVKSPDKVISPTSGGEKGSQHRRRRKRDRAQEELDRKTPASGRVGRTLNGYAQRPAVAPRLNTHESNDSPSVAVASPFWSPLSSEETAVQTRGQDPPPDLPWRTLWNEGTDAVMDVPIGGVCEILYGNDSSAEEEWDWGQQAEWSERE